MQNSRMRPKRKVRRSKKRQYVGWGSISLIRFLQSIGKDTSKEMTQYDVCEIVNQYVRDNNLFDPKKKRRVVCDDKLHSLFRKKSIVRMRIYELLEPHFTGNREDSSSDDDDDDVLPSKSEGEEGGAMALAKCKKQKAVLASEKKAQSSKEVAIEEPKSCFAAIVPSNIGLVYLRRSFVEELLLKDPENFETKVVGCFIRIRCDPYDYLQKNSHQLLPVTGVKKNSGMNCLNEEILLKGSGFVKDIRIRMLSDNDISAEECDDLRQRVKDGLVKRPMIVDIETKARALHEDMTKHWIARELVVLQNQIDRANEKGWRRELDEYLRKKEKLQKPVVQARLLHEIPQVISDVLESESKTKTLDVPDKNAENKNSEVSKAVADDSVCKAATLDIPNHLKQETNSPESGLSLSAASEDPVLNVAVDGSMLNNPQCYDILPVQQQQQPDQQIGIVYKTDGVSKEAESNEDKFSQGLPNKQVIELSNEGRNEETNTAKQVPGEQFESMIWHYRDSLGNVHGPFSLACLKYWSDANFLNPGFKLWKQGQSQDEGVLLVDVLHQLFPT